MRMRLKPSEVGAGAMGNTRAGAAGDFGCFSFYPTKNLGCYGDGGMVTCKKSDAASRLRRLRFHGADHAYLHEEMGLNSRLDSIQAAVLRVRLRHLEEWNEERRLIADRYGMLLAEKGLLEVVRLPEVLEGNYHIFHQYTVRVRGETSSSVFWRNEILRPRSITRFLSICSRASNIWVTAKGISQRPKR